MKIKAKYEWRRVTLWFEIWKKGVEKNERKSKVFKEKLLSDPVIEFKMPRLEIRMSKSQSHSVMQRTVSYLLCTSNMTSIIIPIFASKLSRSYV